ncbi:MAG: lipocalin family protein [Tissierella sp.]|uniref:lipocalin family protein n=1 Tax=Tissierella sp. TaxID=41274 RepID=UPI003F9C3581
MKTFKKDNGSIPIVCDLDLKRYLGNWFEIGRLPLRSEKGLENIRAIYNLKKNGEIEVINSGYKKGKKKEIRGSAWVSDERCKGSLVVRFFWPFKSEYNVIKLDKNYRYAVVMGNTKDNLWILSRTPHMDDKTYGEIIDFLYDKDFDIKKIINPIQDKK